MTPRLAYQLIQAVLTLSALILVILNHFIFAWSCNSGATAWFAATDNSAVQQSKMYVWPWIVILMPADIIWTQFSSKLPDQGLLGAKRHTKPRKNVHPATHVASVGPSVLHAVTANFAALLTTICTVAIVCSIIYYTVGRKDSFTGLILVFIFAGALGMGPVRLALLDYPEAAQWLLIVSAGVAFVTFFTYISYKDSKIFRHPDTDVCNSDQ
jgi:hypothetical protein